MVIFVVRMMSVKTLRSLMGVVWVAVVVAVFFSSSSSFPRPVGAVAAATPNTTAAQPVPVPVPVPVLIWPRKKGRAGGHYVPEARGTAWQYQLSDEGTVRYIPGVDLYIIDLDTARTEIPRLKGLDSDIKVVCYWSAGTWEASRRAQDKDRGANSLSASYLKGSMGGRVDGWPGEVWLDIRKKNVWRMNLKRMRFAKSIGCDGVDPDNVDVYGISEAEAGFEDGGRVRKKDQVAFLKYLAEKAHGLGLGIGLKNAVELVGEVGDVFDWFVSESCVTWGECGAYARYTTGAVGARKAVFGVEYCDARKALGEPTQDPTCVCATARKYGVRMLVKRADLDADRVDCDAMLIIQVDFGDSCASKRPDTCSAVFDASVA